MAKTSRRTKWRRTRLPSVDKVAGTLQMLGQPLMMTIVTEPAHTPLENRLAGPAMPASRESTQDQEMACSCLAPPATLAAHEAGAAKKAEVLL